MPRSPFRVLTVIGLVAFAAGCGDEGVAPAPPRQTETSTWQTIQDEILGPRCVSCHTAGSSFAIQSDLVLTPDVAYAQLVGALPHNAAARADGLVRQGTDGLASVYDSYLWEKINAPNQAHFYSDHPQYGALMPLGEPSLTNGELEFIRRWIVAEAPESGTVVDAAVLEDQTRYTPPDFAPLAPPLHGQQLHLGPFDVAPGTERELFSYVPMDHLEDRLLERVEISMRPGSHHFILYEYRDGTPAGFMPPANTLRDLRIPGGGYNLLVLRQMQYHDFFAGTQWPLMQYSFPPGVALRLPAGRGLDLNSHYVNRGTTPIQAEIFVNLHWAEPANVEHIADILWLSNENIALPPHRVTRLERTFAFNGDVRIFQLFSHAHEHLRRFEAFVVGGPRDGELVYVALDWQHPPILQLDPPLDLDAGQGLRIAATYDNQTDRTITFGLLSTDEMMMLFGYYYGRVPGPPVTVTALP